VTIDILKDFIARRPFTPFRVVASSGETYEIRHPENAVLYRHGLMLAYGERGGKVPEHAAHLSLLHITAVEPITNGRRNGRPSRRKRRR
jgi:hypothetical protein